MDATKKSTNYRLDAPELNPVIVPKGENSPLEAPAGDRFVGVLNPGDDDINGRLVHDAVEGPFRSGTVFTITLFGNRGRLPGAPSPGFPNWPSELTLQFFGWKAGSFPFVDPSSDNWSRTPPSCCPNPSPSGRPMAIGRSSLQLHHQSDASVSASPVVP